MWFLFSDMWKTLLKCIFATCYAVLKGTTFSLKLSLNGGIVRSIMSKLCSQTIARLGKVCTLRTIWCVTFLLKKYSDRFVDLLSCFFNFYPLKWNNLWQQSSDRHFGKSICNHFRWSPGSLSWERRGVKDNCL